MSNGIFYRAPGARTGDVIPKYIDGTYQLFYLKGWKKEKPQNAVDGWHRMESKDLVHMSEETPIYVQGGTGDLIYREGAWHLFSCIFPDGKQYVTHYISRDGSLDQWEYIEEDTFGPDGVIYSCSDWRDPRIVYREDLGEFWMFLAARVNDKHSQTGCVGLCVSKDLKKWEYREPIYYPARFSGACECPDVFRMGDWYYLVFSNYTSLFGTYYVKCQVGKTQWQIPENHRLDARAFYAAKTAGNNEERYLFGWLPTKEENLFGFWPEGIKAQDYRTWDWGGSMVIHRLGQQENGDLCLSIPLNIKEQFVEKVYNLYCPIMSGWRQIRDLWIAEKEEQQQMLLMQTIPHSCYIKTEFAMIDAVWAGVALQVEPAMKEGYYLYVEPAASRLVFRSWLRMSEEGGKTFPYDVELETHIRIPEDGRYVLEIVVEGEMAVAYVNSEAALSFRMCDYTGRRMGIFSLGRSVFNEITMLKRTKQDR